MKVEMDLMTRDEMISLANQNKGTQYSTEDLWEDDQQYVMVDRNGYLVWDNGEEVLNEDEELPEDGWFETSDDCTAWDEDPFLENVSEGEPNSDYYSGYDNPLYDENDY